MPQYGEFSDLSSYKFAQSHIASRSSLYFFSVFYFVLLGMPHLVSTHLLTFNWQHCKSYWKNIYIYKYQMQNVPQLEVFLLLNGWFINWRGRERDKVSVHKSNPLNPLVTEQKKKLFSWILLYCHHFLQELSCQTARLESGYNRYYLKRVFKEDIW